MCWLPVSLLITMLQFTSRGDDKRNKGVDLKGTTGQAEMGEVKQVEMDKITQVERYTEK